MADNTNTEYTSGLKNPIIYWQYKNSPKFLTILEGVISKVKKFYPCELWEILDIDRATGYALDLIGQRLGFPRPKEVPEAVGRYDISRYAQAYYDLSLDQLGLVRDDTYRYMLKLRIAFWQPWRPVSITSFYKALAQAMPGINFYLQRVSGRPIMRCYILSELTYPQRRALFSDAITAPMGETLLFEDRPQGDTLIMTAGGDSAGNEEIITDGSGRVLIANEFF